MARRNATPLNSKRLLIYSSREKFEDAFDSALNAKTAVGCDIFGRFLNFDNCRPEAAGDVISNIASNMSARMSLQACDIRLNRIEIFASVRPDPGRFVQYLIAICSRPKVASDVLSGIFVRPIVLDKSVKFRRP